MKDYTGLKYGKLTVLKFSKRYNNKTYWIAKCDCGKEKEVQIARLVHGDCLSCGCLKKSQRIKDSSGREIYRNYKNWAKKRNYSFSLDYTFFVKTIKSNCHYCGSEPSMETKTTKGYGLFLRNGIDRKDNNIGYEENNCIPCCDICNRAKRELDYNVFKLWINRIATKNKK